MLMNMEDSERIDFGIAEGAMAFCDYNNLHST